MACCSACQHFVQYTGTVAGACQYHQCETATFNRQCQDGFTPKRRRTAEEGR